jgi:hypothetical protein
MVPPMAIMVASNNPSRRARSGFSVTCAIAMIIEGNCCKFKQPVVDWLFGTSTFIKEGSAEGGTMAKINDPSGPKPTPPKEFDLEKEILEGVFKNDEDEVRGSTIGIEAMRAINPRFDTGGADAFDADKKIDIGADKKPEPDFDPKKERRESDQGLTVQMNRILMQRNLKNSGKI